MVTSQTAETRVALVTGAGSGIGRATALAFAREKVTVVVADVNAKTGQAVADEIKHAGGQSLFVQCDVANRNDIALMFERIIQTFGRLDCAFNNAGIGGPVLPMADYPDEDWDNVIATDLTSVWLCMKHEIKQMLKQGGGAIVNCSSVAGFVARPGMSAYRAAKHGILGLTKTAALDYAKQNIRINAVCPGTIQTPAFDAMLSQKKPDEAEKIFASMSSAQPIGRLGAPEEVAAAVLWLCSPGASFMLGHGLIIDGGYVIQ